MATVIRLYEISIKLFLQKLRVIIGFCDNEANPRAKSSLRLSEDIVDSEQETLQSQKLNNFSIKISSFWCFFFV